MSKLKFYKKWKGDQAYSPTYEWEDEASCTVENITIEEPSSPLSTYPLTCNGEKWIIPIDDDDDMKVENFLPQRTSSPIPGKDILY